MCVTEKYRQSLNCQVKKKYVYFEIQFINTTMVANPDFKQRLESGLKPDFRFQILKDSKRI